MKGEITVKFIIINARRLQGLGHMEKMGEERIVKENAAI